jgi:hypothetical protein
MTALYNEIDEAAADVLRHGASPSPAVVRSVYSTQDEILRAILRLHAREGFDCDLTFGNGSFWKTLPKPPHCYDLEPTAEGVKAGSSIKIEHPDRSLGHTVFDPPFLTYVRAGRTGNGKMIMSGRFSGYWRYDELEAHYKGTLQECARVLRGGATLTFKCQDIVHNHKLHPTHINVVQWASEFGLRLKDIFILAAKHRLPAPNRNGSQKHARIFHSYFLVFEQPKARMEALDNHRKAA